MLSPVTELIVSNSCNKIFKNFENTYINEHARKRLATKLNFKAIIA